MQSKYGGKPWKKPHQKNPDLEANKAFNAPTYQPSSTLSKFMLNDFENVIHLVLLGMGPKIK